MNRTIAVAFLGSVISFLSVPAFAQDDKLQVVASFSIIGDFARQVGGDHIALTTLVGPDGDAHVYEPKPTDAMALARADVVLINGMLFEGFLDRLIEASGTEAPVVALTDGIDVLQDADGGHHHYVDGEPVFHAQPNNPHAWQSIAAAKVYVANVATAFCSVDAPNCEDYEANAAAYQDQLSKLDTEVRAAIAAIPEDQRVVVVAHNAYQYFARDYGLSFFSPVGISTDSEASAADVAGLIREIRARNASAVFAENIADSRLVEQIASEAGLTLGGTLYSDSLSEPGGPAPTYVEMTRANVATITQAIAVQ
jgi:zinc/manganese transport system substrate-binding protein